MNRIARFSLLLLTVLASCVGLSQVAYAATPLPAVAPCSTVVAAPRTSIAPAAHAVRTISASIHAAPSAPFSGPQSASLMTMLVGLALMGSVKTVVSDKNTVAPSSDSVRQYFNRLVADFYYFLQNGVLSTTVATLPLCARATTASKVKTTNATVLKEAGIAVALGATDNFWTLTGANIAAGFFRRYLLLDTAGVASVQATAIVGILTIQNATNPFIPGTTLLSAAGVTDTYIDGNDDVVFQSAQVTP
jgi:hypothetical protein